MKDILSRSGREILQQFAWSNVLVAFDYDGTLAPIVPNPERALMRGTTRELLQAITRVYPVVVISGRAQPDALRKLRGSGVLEVIGNHGIEPRHSAERHIAEVRRWLPVLAGHVAPFRGVMIEDKVYSVAVHYRQAREKKRARAAILVAVSELGAVRVIGGKQVVSILPIGAPHKGIALERERDRLGRDTAIYIGDDETDEDVFGLNRPGRLLTVRVGRKRTSQASYYLSGQAAVDDLLAVLLSLRRVSDFALVAHP
jgi:trehalose 6-phosphate phosphatase